MAWEGYREAIDDIRYASTLRLTIERALRGGDPDKARAARQAAQYLEYLDVDQDPDAVRDEIISYVLSLV